MDVISGSKETKIAGAKIGEAVWIHLVNGRAEKILLSEITKAGIEGFQVDFLNQSLTFYPFNNIIKVKKHIEVV